MKYKNTSSRNTNDKLASAFRFCFSRTAHNNIFFVKRSSSGSLVAFRGFHFRATACLRFNSSVCSFFITTSPDCAHVIITMCLTSVEPSLCAGAAGLHSCTLKQQYFALQTEIEVIPANRRVIDAVRSEITFRCDDKNTLLAQISAD